MRCRICQHSDFDFLLAVGDVRYRTSRELFDVLRCGHCGCLVTTRDSDFFDPAESYPEDYQPFLQKESRRPRRLKRLRLAARLRFLTSRSFVASDHLSWTLKLGPLQGARVLDIGCGTGETGEFLSRNFGCEIVGVEPHPKAARIARSRGHEIHQGTLETFGSDELFDVALLIHVLEHLADPLASLRRVHRRLRPGGHLVVALPNAGSWERRAFGAFWDGWDIPRHVHHFHPPSLRYLLRAMDFEVVDFSYEWDSLFSRSMANRLRQNLPYSERVLKFRAVLFEAIWGLLQSLLKRSSALQVIAVRGQNE